MYKISVIIVDYLNPGFTNLCIKSVEMASYKNKEIILIDNSKNNIGLAAAQNKGAKQATGDYLFFLNNDTLVKKDIFENLLNTKSEVVGCRMFDYSGKKLLNGAVSLDRFGCPAAETGPVFYPDGAIFIKKSVFDEIGGFDEKLFLFGEDRDLCWRVFLAGYRVKVNNLAVFFHASDSVSATNYFRRFHAEKNIIRSMLKNYTRTSLFRIIPQYLFWTALELIVILLTKPQAIIKAYIPAYLWIIRNFKDTMRERKKVIHRIPDSEVPFSKVIGKLFVLRTMGIPKWGKRRC